MSIKDRLAKKTADLVGKPSTQIPSDVESVASTVGVTSQDARFPRTAPGQMLAFRSHMQESDKRVDELNARLKEFEGSSLVRLLDPTMVFPSRWANRHSTSFESTAFIQLKDEISAAGVNVQPIRVRPIEEAGKYEIVFGHRRHQACLQLGIAVSALVEQVDDKALFAAMDRENRSRADLSPFEQGEMYRRALDEGLFPSLRQLAAELGVDAGNASKAIAIARLPSQVLAAFQSPTLIQFRWGQELSAAVQKDPDGVISRAKEIRFSAKELAAVDVLNRLLGRQKPLKPKTLDLKKKGKLVGKLVRKSDGSVSLALNSGVLDDVAFGTLRKLVEELTK